MQHDLTRQLADLFAEGPEGGIPDSNITAALALIDKAGSQADIREAARRGLELARTATPAAPSHAVSGEQGGEMRSPRYSAPVELSDDGFQPQTVTLYAGGHVTIEIGAANQVNMGFVVCDEYAEEVHTEDSLTRGAASPKELSDPGTYVISSRVYPKMTCTVTVVPAPAARAACEVTEADAQGETAGLELAASEAASQASTDAADSGTAQEEQPAAQESERIYSYRPGSAQRNSSSPLLLPSPASPKPVPLAALQKPSHKRDGESASQASTAPTPSDTKAGEPGARALDAASVTNSDVGQPQPVNKRARQEASPPKASGPAPASTDLGSAASPDSLQPATTQAILSSALSATVSSAQDSGLCSNSCLAAGGISTSREFMVGSGDLSDSRRQARPMSAGTKRHLRQAARGSGPAQHVRQERLSSASAAVGSPGPTAALAAPSGEQGEAQWGGALREANHGTPSAGSSRAASPAKTASKASVPGTAVLDTSQENCAEPVVKRDSDSQTGSAWPGTMTQARRPPGRSIGMSTVGMAGQTSTTGTSTEQLVEHPWEVSLAERVGMRLPPLQHQPESLRTQPRQGQPASVLAQVCAAEDRLAGWRHSQGWHKEPARRSGSPSDSDDSTEVQELHNQSKPLPAKAWRSVGRQGDLSAGQGADSPLDLSILRQEDPLERRQGAMPRTSAQAAAGSRREGSSPGSPEPKSEGRDSLDMFAEQRRLQQRARPQLSRSSAGTVAAADAAAAALRGSRLPHGEVGRRDGQQTGFLHGRSDRLSQVPQVDKFNCIDDRDLHLLEEAMQSQGGSSRAQDSFMRRVQLNRQPRGLPDDEHLPLLGHGYRHDDHQDNSNMEVDDVVYSYNSESSPQDPRHRSLGGLHRPTGAARTRAHIASAVGPKRHPIKCTGCPQEFACPINALRCARRDAFKPRKWGPNRRTVGPSQEDLGIFIEGLGEGDLCRVLDMSTGRHRVLREKCLKYLQQETFFSHQRSIRDALQTLMVAVTNVPQGAGELLDDKRVTSAFTGQQLNMCLEICTEGMLGVPQTPDFEEDAWKREDNLPALLAFTLEKNILVAREEHRVREEARAEELRRLALAELEVGDEGQQIQKQARASKKGRSRQRKQAPKRCAEAEVPAGDGAALPELAAEQPDAAKAPAAAGEQISDAGAAPTGLATAAEDPALAEATAGDISDAAPPEQRAASFELPEQDDAKQRGFSSASEPGAPAELQTAVVTLRSPQAAPSSAFEGVALEQAGAAESADDSRAGQGLAATAGEQGQVPAPAESGLSAARPRTKPRSKTQRAAAAAATAAPKHQAEDAAAAAPADEDLAGSATVVRQPEPAAAILACSAAEDLPGTAAAKQAAPVAARPEQTTAAPSQADGGDSLAQQEPKPLTRRQQAKKRRAEKRERQMHKQAEEAEAPAAPLAAESSQADPAAEDPAEPEVLPPRRQQRQRRGPPPVSLDASRLEGGAEAGTVPSAAQSGTKPALGLQLNQSGPAQASQDVGGLAERAQAGTGVAAGQQRRQRGYPWRGAGGAPAAMNAAEAGPPDMVLQHKQQGLRPASAQRRGGAHGPGQQASLELQDAGGEPAGQPQEDGKGVRQPAGQPQPQSDVNEAITSSAPAARQLWPGRVIEVPGRSRSPRPASAGQSRGRGQSPSVDRGAEGAAAAAQQQPAPRPSRLRDASPALEASASLTQPVNEAAGPSGSAPAGQQQRRGGGGGPAAARRPPVQQVQDQEGLPRSGSPSAASDASGVSGGPQQQLPQRPPRRSRPQRTYIPVQLLPTQRPAPASAPHEVPQTPGADGPRQGAQHRSIPALQAPYRRQLPPTTEPTAVHAAPTSLQHGPAAGAAESLRQSRQGGQQQGHIIAPAAGPTPYAEHDVPAQAETSALVDIHQWSPVEHGAPSQARPAASDCSSGGPLLPPAHQPLPQPHSLPRATQSGSNAQTQAEQQHWPGAVLSGSSALADATQLVPSEAAARQRPGSAKAGPPPGFEQAGQAQGPSGVAVASGMSAGLASSHQGPASTPAHLPRQVSQPHAGLAGPAPAQAASGGATPGAVVAPSALRFGSFTCPADAPFVQPPLSAAGPEQQAGTTAPPAPQMQQMGAPPAGPALFAQGHGSAAAAVHFTVPVAAATAGGPLGTMLVPPTPHLGPAAAESDGELGQRQDAAYPPVSHGGQGRGPASAENAQPLVEQPHQESHRSQEPAQGQPVHAHGGVHSGGYMAPYLLRPQGPDEAGFCQDPSWSQAMYMQGAYGSMPGFPPPDGMSQQQMWWHSHHQQMMAMPPRYGQHFYGYGPMQGPHHGDPTQNMHGLVQQLVQEEARGSSPSRAHPVRGSDHSQAAQHMPSHMIAKLAANVQAQQQQQGAVPGQPLLAPPAVPSEPASSSSAPQEAGTGGESLPEEEWPALGSAPEPRRRPRQEPQAAVREPDDVQGAPRQPAAQHSVPGSPAGRGPRQHPGRFQHRHAQVQHPRQGQGHPVGAQSQQQWYDQSGHEWWGGYYPDPGEWDQAWYGPGYGDPHPAGDGMHGDPASSGPNFWYPPQMLPASFHPPPYLQQPLAPQQQQHHSFGPPVMAQPAPAPAMMPPQFEPHTGLYERPDSQSRPLRGGGSRSPRKHVQGSSNPFAAQVKASLQAASVNTMQ